MIGVAETSDRPCIGEQSGSTIRSDTKDWDGNRRGNENQQQDRRRRNPRLKRRAMESYIYGRRRGDGRLDPSGASARMRIQPRGVELLVVPAKAHRSQECIAVMVAFGNRLFRVSTSRHGVSAYAIRPSGSSAGVATNRPERTNQVSRVAGASDFQWL